ncbi:hypothetical protein BU16DRAFT_563239 [Lophium mytilinum]|uniref:Uncharacterized protein n=1 Tax=Lophium mytilinum TaxID=390894 RepID=A0A6A6QP72_9PEZI|nr:hypothetical protein BU16DRAFT_563239 [Lophium mytilinum]
MTNYPAMFSLFHISERIARARESKSTELSNARFEISGSSTSKDFAMRYKQKHPEACHYVYPGRQPKHLFDKHDISTKDGSFLVEIYHDDLLETFEIIDACGVFQQEEIEYYGREFLWHALNEMKSELSWVAEFQQEQGVDGSLEQAQVIVFEDPREGMSPKVDGTISTKAERRRSESRPSAEAGSPTIGNDSLLLKTGNSKMTSSKKVVTRPDLQVEVGAEDVLGTNGVQSPKGKKSKLTRKANFSKTEHSRNFSHDKATKKDRESKNKAESRKKTNPEQKERNIGQRVGRPKQKGRQGKQQDRKVEQREGRPEKKKTKPDQKTRKPRGAKTPKQQNGTAPQDRPKHADVPKRHHKPRNQPNSKDEQKTKRKTR